MSAAEVPVVARRGRKDPALLKRESTATVVVATPGYETFYVVSRKPMRHRGSVLAIGDEVPGAGDWPRLEAWLGARLVEARTRPCQTEPPEESPVEE